MLLDYHFNYHLESVQYIVARLILLKLELYHVTAPMKTPTAIYITQKKIQATLAYSRRLIITSHLHLSGHVFNHAVPNSLCSTLACLLLLKYSGCGDPSGSPSLMFPFSGMFSRNFYTFTPSFTSSSCYILFLH